MPEKFAGKFGEEEKPIPEEPSEADETGKPEQKEVKELHLSPEEREVVMGKFEELLMSEDLVLRFENLERFKEYSHQEKLPRCEAMLLKNTGFIEFLEEAKVAFPEKEKGINWEVVANRLTDWGLSVGESLEYSGLIQQYLQYVQEARRKIKKGEIAKEEPREYALKRMREFLLSPEPDISQGTYYSYFVGFLKGVRFYKEMEQDLRNSLEQARNENNTRKAERLRGAIEQIQGKIDESLEHLLREKVYQGYERQDIYQKYKEVLHNFIKDESYLLREKGNLRKVLEAVAATKCLRPPYNLLLFLKKENFSRGPKGTAAKWQEGKIYWGEISKDTLVKQAIIGILGFFPSRIYIKSLIDVQKYIEAPVFDWGGNPRWPNDPEVLAEMKKKIAEIRQQIKDEQAEKQKNQTKEEE